MDKKRIPLCYQDSVNYRISHNQPLTDDEIDSGVALLGKGCRPKTKLKLKRYLQYVPNISNYGIYNRLHIRNGKIEYCASQSYPDEIRLIRKLLLT